MTLPESIAAAHLGTESLDTVGRTVFEFRFGVEHPAFAGHFPGQPILPGVLQLEIARCAVEWLLDCPLAIHVISKAKFLRPILPDEIVRLELRLKENSNSIEARAAFSVDGKPAGETVLQLRHKV